MNEFNRTEFLKQIGEPYLINHDGQKEPLRILTAELEQEEELCEQ